MVKLKRDQVITLLGKLLKKEKQYQNLKELM